MELELIEVVEKTDLTKGFDPDIYSEEFINFVKDCLTVDHLKRPCASILLQHPFIARSGEVKELGVWIKKNYLEVVKRKKKTK